MVYQTQRLLHQTFAESTSSDDQSAVPVLDTPGGDFRGGGGVFVHQHVNLLLQYGDIVSDGVGEDVITFFPLLTILRFVAVKVLDGKLALFRIFAQDEGAFDVVLVHEDFRHFGIMSVNLVHKRVLQHDSIVEQVVEYELVHPFLCSLSGILCIVDVDFVEAVFQEQEHDILFCLTMKKTLILLFVCLLGISASFAQEKETTTKEEGYKFRNLKEIPITSVKDQHRAGTCWCVVGVVTRLGKCIRAKKVILTNGTFLNGVIHVGESHYAGGRMGEDASFTLSDQLKEKGITVAKLKTGTPVRIDGRTVDFSKMVEQPGDPNPMKFSFTETPTLKEQLSCWITYTNEEVHDILRTGFEKSPMFQGRIQGVGPRYCPSIEDKIVRFEGRERHQLFLEHLSADVADDRGLL